MRGLAARRQPGCCGLLAGGGVTCAKLLLA